MKLENFLIQFNNSLRFSNTSPKHGVSFYTNSKTKLSQLPNELSYIFSLVFFGKISNIVFHEFRHFLQNIQQFSDNFLYNSKTLHLFLLFFHTNSKITLSRLPNESSYFLTRLLQKVVYEGFSRSSTIYSANTTIL